MSKIDIFADIKSDILMIEVMNWMRILRNSSNILAHYSIYFNDKSNDLSVRLAERGGAKKEWVNTKEFADSSV